MNWRCETNEKRREKEGTILIGFRLRLLLAASISSPRQEQGDCWLYQRPDGISNSGATTLIGHYHTRLHPASSRSARSHGGSCAFSWAFRQLFLMMCTSFCSRSAKERRRGMRVSTTEHESFNFLQKSITTLKNIEPLCIFFSFLVGCFVKKKSTCHKNEGTGIQSSL